MHSNYTRGVFHSVMRWVFLGLLFAILSGCLVVQITADKTTVPLGDKATLTATCIPPDPGDYPYYWFCVEQPTGSKIPFLFAKGSPTVDFIPDVVGEYKIECKSYSNPVKGFGLGSIIITCIGGASWSVEPRALDYGYIQTDKKIVVENTGLVPITVTVDRSATEAFVTEITTPANPIAPGENREINVKVDRQGLAWGQYDTTFVLNMMSDLYGQQQKMLAPESDSVTISVTMKVGIAKILFTVDSSGSLAENDPGDKRVSAVKETINKFYDNELVSFGIIDFDTIARTLTGFTRDRTLLNNCADQLANDEGWTNYLGTHAPYYPGALDLVDSVVDETQTNAHFVVIFLSDGEPTQGNLDHDAIVAKVSAIASPENVKLYTLYLNGDPEPVAEQLLNDMAVAGKTGQTHVYTDPDSLSFLNLDF